MNYYWVFKQKSYYPIITQYRVKNTYPEFLILWNLTLNEFTERQLTIGHKQVFDNSVVEHCQAQSVGVLDVLGEILVPDGIIGFGHCRRPEQYVVVDVDADIGVQQRILRLHKRHVLETGLQVGGPQAGRLAELDAYGARKRLVHRHGRTVAVVLLLDADHGAGSTRKNLNPTTPYLLRRSRPWNILYLNV